LHRRLMVDRVMETRIFTLQPFTNARCSTLACARPALGVARRNFELSRFAVPFVVGIISFALALVCDTLQDHVNCCTLRAALLSLA